MPDIRLITPQVIRVTGVPRSAEQAVRAGAARIQQRMAETFELSRTYAGPLKANTRTYEVRKVLAGFDIRRGHRTGNLQDHFYSLKLWSIRWSSGAFEVTFHESRLYAAVEYAEYYAAKKAKGRSLVGVERSWLQDMRASLARVRTEPTRERPDRDRRRTQFRPSIIRRELGTAVEVR